MALKEQVSNLIPCRSLAFFKTLTLFVDLPDEEVMRFSTVAQIKNYKKGQFLYRENEQAKFFHVICTGWLKLFHTTAEGEEMILAMLTRDNITGVNALFEEEHFTMNAQVVDDAEILSIPLTLLKERVRMDNQLALNMLSYMVQQQRRYEVQQEQNLFYSAPQRVGCFLLGLCPIPERKDGVILTLPYDKVQIASALAMKAPTFSRALHVLCEEASIHITGTSVTIDSVERLLTFVGSGYSPSLIRTET